MAEKSSLSGDTVSLPPTYAPSETYTDSPPPAYHGKRGLVGVRIARLVCCTLLAITFLVGFFVITHKYIQSGRNCNCHNNFQSLDDVRAASLLAAPAMKLDNNKIEDDIALKDEHEEKKKETKQIIEDIEIPDDMLLDITDDKDIILPDIPTEEVVHEVNKNVELPKDVLLGNPKLIGKNVQCRVEKKQQKLAEEIMTQTIIVTCDDNENEDENGDINTIEHNMLPPPPLLKSPPMSIFGTLMKIIAENSRANRESVMEGRPFNLRNEPRGRMIPIIRPIRPDESFPGPFPLPLSKFEGNDEPFQSFREEKSFSPIILRRPPPEIIQGSRRQNVLPPLFPPFFRLAGRQPRNFELPERKIPIKIVRIPPSVNELNDEPISQIRQINDNDDGDDEFTPRFFPFGKKVIQIRPMNSPDSAPLRPFSDIDDGLPIPHLPKELPPPTMPEASARALPAPVALPDVKLFRLPLIPRNPIIPEKRLMTHMEIEEQIPRETQDDSQTENLLQDAIENDQTSGDFGPPRVHTLFSQPIEAPSAVFKSAEPQQNPHQENLTNMPTEPEPHFSPEGRFSEFAKVNADAEVFPIHSSESTH